MGGAMSSIVLSHPLRVLKAVVTNVVAGVAPGAYSRWTSETGRGREPATIEETADYFLSCIRDYRDELGLSETGFREWLKDKDVLEYGPGDIPGVALLLIAYGAKSVVCADGFPLIKLSAFNESVLVALVDRMQGDDRERALNAMQAFRETLGRSGAIRYITSRTGTYGVADSVDLIISRAVLEHVRDLRRTFHDMKIVMRKGGCAVHLVDLKSHGMHIDNPLDFLCWPSSLWALMYANKGAPNRKRPDYYRRLASEVGLAVERYRPTGFVDERQWGDLKVSFAAEFRDLAYEDAACQGFWMILRHASR